MPKMMAVQRSQNHKNGSDIDINRFQKMAYLQICGVNLKVTPDINL